MTAKDEAKYLLASIVDSSNDSIVSVNGYDIITTWNRAAEILYGYPAAEAIGRPLSMVMLPADIKPVFARINSVIRGGAPERFDTVRVKKGGEEISLEIVLSPVKDETGNIIGVSTIARDITAREEAEKLRQQVEAGRQNAYSRYKEMLESINDVFYTLDHNYTYEYVNRKAEEAWGISREDVLGKTMWQVFPMVIGTQSEAMHRRAMETRQTVHYETLSSILNRWIAVSIFPAQTGGLSVYFHDIEDRKRAEEAIRESREHLSAVFHEAGVGLSEVTLYGQFIHVNNGLCRMLGYTREELLALTLQDVTFAPDLPASLQHLAMLIDTGSPVSIDKRFKHKDGHPIWTNTALSLISMNNGKQLVLAVTTDLTERKKAEADLKESEVRARTLADAVPHIIWTNTADGVADYFNKRWYEYSGLTYDQSVGLCWEAIIHPADAQVSKERWKKALEKGEVFDTEYRLRRYDGEYRCFIGRNVPLHNSEGKVTAWFGSATDINDLNEAREAERASEHRLRVTMDSAIDYSIITSDAAGIITDWSIGASRTFAYTASQAIGQHTSIIFTPEDRAAGAPEKEMMTAVRDGFALDERWHLRADGTRFYMSGVMRPIYNPQLTGFVKVARDVTRQKLLEQQKDDFISAASHELKTPITSISVYGQLLEDTFNESGDDENAALMHKMNGQVARLTELVNTMLDVTRISQGQLEISKVRFYLADMVREVADQMQLTTTHPLQVQVQDTGEVFADYARIRQVVVNFLSNAIKYSPASERVIVTVSRSDAGHAMLCVQDFGPGMSSEVSARVFERFYRSPEGMAGTYPGLGLGLYISAEIIREHGGRIWADSRPGEGSTFCFTLPPTDTTNA